MSQRLVGVLYVKIPKAFFPSEDRGFIFGTTRASVDVSFQAMVSLQQQVAGIVMADPAVASIGSLINGAGQGTNRGSIFITLNSLEARDHVSTQRVIDRSRRSSPSAWRVSMVQPTFPAIRTPHPARTCAASWRHGYWWSVRVSGAHPLYDTRDLPLNRPSAVAAASIVEGFGVSQPLREAAKATSAVRIIQRNAKLRGRRNR